MKIDEFALADMENDEKKCEDHSIDSLNSPINTSNLKDNEKDEEIYDYKIKDRKQAIKTYSEAGIK